MVELGNPGVSGSIFYLTQDDKFIAKTVQHKEAGFLTKLLPGYYMNLKQVHTLKHQKLIQRWAKVYAPGCVNAAGKLS